MTTTTAPDLWPGMDRSTATARAWIEVWNAVHPERWESMADVIESVGYACPEVKRKTIDNIIRQARTARLVQRRGGYSHKNKTDTRMIRRHPATQERTAS